MPATKINSNFSKCLGNCIFLPSSLSFLFMYRPLVSLMFQSGQFYPASIVRSLGRRPFYTCYKNNITILIIIYHCRHHWLWRSIRSLSTPVRGKSESDGKLQTFHRGMQSSLRSEERCSGAFVVAYCEVQI